jgi:predicted nucleic acid-binding protein
MRFWYLDASALVKLVKLEPESAALYAWLGDREPVMSRLGLTEAIRSVRRHEPTRVSQAEELASAIDMVPLTEEVWSRAAALDPAVLRTLDALHVAAAQTLGDLLAGMVAYDVRLRGAAEALGIAVEAPA